MTPLRHILIIILALAPAAIAAPRLWKNSDASRSFRGEFVKRDKTNVTIQMLPSHKQVSIRYDQLHRNDIEWLKETHPLDSEKPPVTAVATDPMAIYDKIALGDERNVVMQKLRQCKSVKSSIPETLMGRTGLNGVYQTIKGSEFFGMPTSLYFGWDESNALKEMSFHSSPVSQKKIDESLIPQRNQMIANLTQIYGNPSGAVPKLDLSSLKDTDIIFTHTWKLQPRGSLLLGTGRDGDNYMVIVRYSSEKF